MVLTVVCIFLPLSAIWAGVANDSIIAHRGRDAHHRLIDSEFGRSSATSATATADTTTTFDKSRQTSCATCTYAKKGEILDTPRCSPGGRRSMGGVDAILVDHEYTVQHEAIPLDRV